MLDKKEFATILATFADMCGKELRTPTIYAYYDVLKDYSTEDVQKAAKHILRTHKFNTIPLPALFVEAIEGSTKTKAVEAWESRQRGADKLTTKVLSCCDQILPETTYDELKWIRKQFLEIYETMQHKQEYYCQAQLESKSADITSLISTITSTKKLI